MIGMFILEKMKCFRIGRGSYAIRVNKKDVYNVERQYSKQLAEWCVSKWNFKFPNLAKVINEDQMKMLSNGMNNLPTVNKFSSSSMLDARRTSVASQINEQNSIKTLNSSFVQPLSIPSKPSMAPTSMTYFSPQWDPTIPVIQPEVVTLDQVPGLAWDDLVLGTGVCYLKDGEAMKVCPYSLSVEMAMVEMGVKYKLIHTHLVGLQKEPWFIALHPKGKPSSPFLWSHGRWIFDTLPILDELMKRFPSRNSESIMPFKDHMKARSVYKGAPINKLSETVDDSADHYKYRMKTTDMLKPFLNQLRDNKFLGGDKISFSDCHFCQQLGNGRQLIEYLKKIDLIEENEILRAYWDRLTKMKCFRIGRGSYAIRTAKADVYGVERQY